MLWKRERPRDMTHLMDFSLPYSKPYSRVKKVDTPLMDSNRNQPRNTHHQGSQQPADLFFFLTGGGLGQGEGGNGGRKRGRHTRCSSQIKPVTCLLYTDIFVSVSACWPVC